MLLRGLEAAVLMLVLLFHPRSTAEFSPGPRFQRVVNRHAASGGRMLPWDMLQLV